MRHILYQHRNILNATAKFLWERVERLLDYLDEMLALHPSPTEINRGTLTPSSRRRSCRHHRHLLFLCRRLQIGETVELKTFLMTQFGSELYAARRQCDESRRPARLPAKAILALTGYTATS